MPESFSDRIREIENSQYKIRVWVAVLSALGLTIAASLAYLTIQANAVREDIQNAGRDINNLNTDIGSLQAKLREIDGVIESTIARVSTDRALTASFNETSVLAQVQAQAICSTFVAGSNQSVRAVYRKSVSNGARRQGLACSAVCEGVDSYLGRELNSDKISVHGAVHIYSAAPPSNLAQLDSPIFGLNTFVYSSWEGSAFGPNYCCCGHK